MKSIFIYISFVSIFIASTGFSQNRLKSLPNTQIEDLNGNNIETSSLVNEEGLMVISFWATWCKPCIIELNELQDVYSDWKEEANIKIVAISIDDSRSSSKVPGFVRGKGWEFDFYLDKNSDLKRAMNITDVPHSFLVNKEGKIVWQHAGYSLGDEEILFEEILKNL